MNRVHEAFVKSKGHTDPIGWFRGRPIFPILGGSPEGDESTDEFEEDEDEDEESGSESHDDSDADTDKSKKSKSKDDDDDDEEDSEAEKLRKRMKAADRRASAAEAKIKQLEKKDQTALEAAQSEAAEAKETLTTVQAENSGLRLKVAFLESNTIQWQNPGVAIKVAQADGYLDDVVEDDGTVDSKALKAALSKVARDHEYLVKKSTSEKKTGASGEPGPEGNGNSKDDKKSKSVIKSRFTALNR